MAETIESKHRPALSGWPMIIAWLAMLIFACHASTHMVGAGDTWVAMACGRHFLNHGVDTVEPFSANSHRPGPTEKDIKKWPPAARWIADKVGIDTVKYWHPTGWINQNWLTHVIFYWLTHESPFADAETYSFNSVVYWKFALYILTIICTYYIGRVLGVNPALSATFACAALFIGRSFFDVRPAGFSNLLVAVFLLVLALATYKDIKYIWLIVPVTVFWCNVHGGYIYVFIMLVPFVGLNLLTSFFPGKFVTIGLKGIFHTIGAGFAALIASILFNPFHLTNLTHTFIISVSKHAEMWRSVNEWHPAFEWSNPVGTGFPLLVMYILSIGLTIFWVFSRFFKPKLLRMPQKEMQLQQKRFIFFSKILGVAIAVLVGWCTFISLSFLNLQPGDLFICALFIFIILLSISNSIHFIYVTIGLILMALWASGPEANYLGRYFYPFVLLPVYVITHLIISRFVKSVKIKPENIIYVAGTSLVALVLMVLIFNPFKFDSVWKLNQLFDMKRVWRPIYERNIASPDKYLFESIFVANIISVIIWLTTGHLQKLLQKISKILPQQQSADGPYELPKIDLAMIVIAALTIYMAIRSRRFITIAAIAACPVIAMFIDQMTRTICAVHNFYKKNSLSVSPMPRQVQAFFLLAGTVVTLALGCRWTLKFNHVYLEPWPTDAKLNSVFMRMTASSAKPFWACQFIRDNKLSGKMFNYWTEGGFLAWGQVPDPNTGRTPLRLFMDGRAQAAYEPSAYHKWAGIMSGGPAVRNAKVRRRNLNTNDYKEVGKWVGKELRKHNVWLVLMPSKEWRGPLVKGLEHNAGWPIVFLNNKQKMFVDISTEKGKKLFEGIFNNQTIYPDEFTRHLALAHNMYLYGSLKSKEQAFNAAVKAFNLYPSQIAMLEVRVASKYNELKPKVIAFCENYLADFEKNKGSYAREDGYDHKVVAALVAADHLREQFKRQKNNSRAEYYANKIKEYEDERRQIISLKKW